MATYKIAVLGGDGIGQDGQALTTDAGDTIAGQIR